MVLEDPGEALADRVCHDASFSNNEHLGEIEKLQIKFQENQTQRNKKSVDDLVNQNAFVPIRIGSSVVTGVQDIRQGIIQRHLDETVYKSLNLNQLLQESDQLYRLLCINGIAESASQTLDSSRTIKHPFVSTFIPTNGRIENTESLRDLNIVDVIHHVDISPVKRFSAKTGTNIGNGEGDGYLQFQWRNVFGGGERISFNATKGTKTQSSYLFHIVGPLIAPWWNCELAMFKNCTQLGGGFGHELYSRGGKLSIISHFDPKRSWNHQLNFETTWRTALNRTHLQPSDSLLIQFGDNLKSSFHYDIVKDTRDNSVFATRGSLTRFSQEYSVKQYWKTMMELSMAKSFRQNDFITISSTMKTGYIWRMNSGLLHMADKFYNGGSNDIRGFDLMSLGPKDIRDPVGGDAFISYGLSIFSRIPLRKVVDSGLRLHWFINGGRLINHNKMAWSPLLETLAKEHSLSTGIGIVFKHPAARFELNFTLPLSAHASDGIRKGIQYGIGISFL